MFRKFFYAFIILIIAVIAFGVIGVYISEGVEYEKIKCNYGGETIVKTAHISDLQYPKTKADLTEIIKELENYKPDFIFLTGDIIDSSASKSDVSELKAFLSDLKQFDNVFAISGNHEPINENLNYYKSLLKENGITFLENEFRTVNFKNKNITVAGIPDKGEYGYTALNGLSSVNKNNILFLLAHRPENWDAYLSATELHKPLAVFSGHTHGGQIRLFGSGVYVRGEGFFPKYCAGLYKKKDSDSVMIVSRGLGESDFPYRIYNKYHLPLVTFYI